MELRINRVRINRSRPVVCLMGKGSDDDYKHVGTHSPPLTLVTSVKQGKLPAMLKCVHLCNCILMFPLYVTV